MPAIVRWSRSSACSGRGASSISASGGGSGHASGPSLASISSPASSPARRSLTQAACLEPNSRRRSSSSSPSGSAPSGARTRTSSLEVRSRGPARLSYSCSRPADIRWISNTSSPETSDDQVLAPPAHARDRLALQDGERRVERLQRVDAGRERPLDSSASQRPVEQARGDLDLGQLGHPPIVG